MLAHLVDWWPHILGAIVAGFVGWCSSRIWTKANPYNRIREWHRHRSLTSRIKKEYLGVFKAKKAGNGNTVYYFRDRDSYRKTAFGAPFELLNDQDIQLRKLRAFLIPPLDNGRAGLEKTSESLVVQTAEAWKHYFDAIGKKAKEAQGVSAQAIAQRIIFFDKFLLDFFLNDEKWAVECSGVSTDGHLSMPSNASGLGRFAQYAIRTAYHLITIHRYNRPYAGAVETRFIDKSVVQSNQYYDFGLYDFSGVTLVYMPHFLKTKEKTMVGDKVLVGDSSHQREAIREFEDDFNELWRLCEENKSTETRLMSDPDAGNAARQELATLSSSSFERLYYNPLLERLLKLGWIPADS